MQEVAEHQPAWDTAQLRTVTALVAEAEKQLRRDGAFAHRFGDAYASIARQDVGTLLSRLATVEHPLLGWALHVALDERDVPPVLRGGMQSHTHQHVFLNALADLHWLAVRHPGHKTMNQRVRNVFVYTPRDEAWHRVALWAYRQSHGAGHRVATALGLTADQRQFTLTMPTKEQAGDRRALRNASGSMCHLPA